MKKKDLVVFDFDGTLSARDSNFEFGKYCFRHSLRPWLFLPIVFIAGIASVCNHRGIWWRVQMRSFITPKMIRRLAPGFIKEHKKRRFSWARAEVEKQRAIGNIVILISAGPDYLIPQLVKDMKFDAVICSDMNKDKPNIYNFFCWNKNKVIAMDNWAKKNKFVPNLVCSYSDSKNDLPIMNLAKKQIWVNPKTGIKKC